GGDPPVAELTWQLLTANGLSGGNHTPAATYTPNTMEPVLQEDGTWPFVNEFVTEAGIVGTLDNGLYHPNISLRSPDPDPSAPDTGSASIFYHVDPLNNGTGTFYMIQNNSWLFLGEPYGDCRADSGIPII